MKRTVLSMIICVLCAAMLISTLGMNTQACGVYSAAYGNSSNRRWVSATNGCNHS